MKTKRAISIILAVFMLLTPLFTLHTQAVELKDSVASTSSMQVYQDFLDAVMDEHDISGVAYFTKNGRVLCQSARGMQNTKENRPITMDSLFCIGSVSKQFCATAVLMLHEQGKLSLNDTLDKYFPEYTSGKAITIDHLLAMRSGIRDIVNTDYSYRGHEYPTEEYTLLANATEEENNKIITDWLFTQKLKFTPGLAFSYSNSNYFLLSLIIEQVTGMHYQSFIKENILEPLNMTNTGFFAELKDSPDLVEDCIPEDEPIEEIMLIVSVSSKGCGDLVSNAYDMDKWLTSLSNNTLLSEESYKKLTTGYSNTEGVKYGYGLFIDPDNGVFYHGGNALTYESVALTCPDDDYNVFMVTNDVDSVTKLGLSMTIIARAMTEQINTDVMFGDVDGDGDISIIDATAIQLHVAQLQPISDDLAIYGDTDNDGDISVMDATAIQLFIAGL